jgi:hypothetical protein
MIAEVFPEAYDSKGRQTFRPDQRRRSHFPSTLPIGRYLSQPLSVECKDLEDLRSFLRKCRYVSDEEQFGRRDFWIPPEEFELSRKGDCEDFALYAWRQLLSLGYSTRFVGGKHGRYGEGHAWVTFEKDGKNYLMEPQACSLGPRLPRLSTLAYKPDVSVEWDGERRTSILTRNASLSRRYDKSPRLSRNGFTATPGSSSEWRTLSRLTWRRGPLEGSRKWENEAAHCTYVFFKYSAVDCIKSL